jgi:hypothetical protein
LRHNYNINMLLSTDDQILRKIKKAKRGTLFFIDDFIDFGNAKTVGKALERLVKSGELHRIATGIYVRPAKDKVLGIVFPGIEDVAEAIRKRDKARIVPTGSYAMYKLGLTTQVPMNIVYYTDSTARKIKIGKQTITFKRASARNLSAIGEISKLVIQAMRTIGKDKVTNSEINKIKDLLRQEKPFHLQHDLKIAPEWIRKLLKS